MSELPVFDAYMLTHLSQIKPRRLLLKQLRTPLYPSILPRLSYRLPLPGPLAKSKLWRFSKNSLRKDISTAEVRLRPRTQARSKMLYSAADTDLS